MRKIRFEQASIGAKHRLGTNFWVQSCRAFSEKLAVPMPFVSKFWAVALLVCASFEAKAQPGVAPFVIPFLDEPPRVDGSPDDWDMTAAPAWQVAGQQPKYRNTACARLGFDEDNLYGVFAVEDGNLIEIETSPGTPRLHLNDGVELYLDTRADSRQTMDGNDFQILMDVRGRTVVLRGGDKYQLVTLESRVPKDTVTQVFSIRTAAQQRGTVNDTTDRDAGFSVEFSIPWAALGIRPRDGLPLRLDLCLNDNDTLMDFRPVPEGVVIQPLSFQSITGSVDFGFPDTWLAARLIGQAGWLHRLERRAGRHGLALIFVGAFVLLPGLGWLAWRNFRLGQQVKSRADLPQNMAALVAPSEAETLPPNEPTTVGPNWPLVLAARKIVEENMEEDLTPSVLAGRLFVSLRQLQRVFRDELGTTPNQFIASLKMEQALALLRSGQSNVTEAAFAVGFSDPSYFSKVFKKYHGVPPREVARA